MSQSVIRTVLFSLLPQRLHLGRDSLVIYILVVWIEYINAFGRVHMWKKNIQVVYGLRTIITDVNESDRRKALWSHHHYQDVTQSQLASLLTSGSLVELRMRTLPRCHLPHTPDQKAPFLISIAHYFNHWSFSLAVVVVVVVTFDFRQKTPPFQLSRGGQSPAF